MESTRDYNHSQGPNLKSALSKAHNVNSGGPWAGGSLTTSPSELLAIKAKGSALDMQLPAFDTTVSTEVPLWRLVRDSPGSQELKRMSRNPLGEKKNIAKEKQEP